MSEVQHEVRIEVRHHKGHNPEAFCYFDGKNIDEFVDSLEIKDIVDTIQADHNSGRNEGLIDHCYYKRWKFNKAILTNKRVTYRFSVSSVS